MNTILVMGRSSEWSRLFLEQLKKAKGAEHYQITYESEWPAEEIPDYILIDLNEEKAAGARLALQLLRETRPDSAIVCFRELNDLEYIVLEYGTTSTHSALLRQVIGWPGYAIRHLEIARVALREYQKKNGRHLD